MPLLLVPRWSRSKTADEPAKEKENGTGENDGNARRVTPGMVDILANIQKRPKKKRTSAEILNDLGGLIRDRRESFAFGKIREISEF